MLCDEGSVVMAGDISLVLAGKRIVFGFFGLGGWRGGNPDKSSASRGYSALEDACFAQRNKINEVS